MPPLLHEYFHRAAARWPDAPALDIPPGSGRPLRTTLTYAALDAWSADVAARLPARVGPEALVAVLVARASPWLVASQLGVLRAGGAFTCLEPTFPDAHLRALLDGAAPAAIVADAPGAARLAALGRTADVVVGGEHPSAAVTPAATRPPAATADGSSLAYAIYTSGTTGRPKGVLVEHRSVVNLVRADLEEFGLGPGDRVAQGSSAAYDSSIEETWLALAAGATLVVADDATVRLGPDLIAWLARERITVFCPPPTLLRATGCADPATALPDLRLLYVGGEALPPDVAERWGRGRLLVNGYGPTEATVTVVRERVRPGAPIAIGRPIAGVSAWVLDADGEVAPAGEPGELCLGGIALARGYRGEPALTSARFPQHPRLGRIYRTGDRAVCDGEGRLFYLGRLDAQVKLRGYRIELEAVESRLAAQPGVAQAAATIQGDGAAQRLVAVIVPADRQAPPRLGAVFDALRADLPPYMVPARLEVVDRLPTTVGGKLDRAALPVLGDGTAHAAAARQVVAPATPAARAIAAAVAEVLRPPGAVSIHDDIFGDLGGDSLAVGLLVSRLRGDAATAHLTTRDVYEARTVAALARRTAPRSSASAPTAAAGPVPLAPLGRLVAATAVQTGWIVGEVALLSSAAYAAVAVVVPWLDARIGLLGLFAAAPGLVAAARAVWTPLAVAMTAVAARMLLPDPPVGRHPAWGHVHVRLWLLQRLAAHVPWDDLAGTHAMSAALRLLGAEVGHHVHVARGVQLPHGAWARLHLGDRVSLARDASLRAVDLDRGAVVIGDVHVADGTTLDVHAGMGPATRTEAAATLGPWASLEGGTHVPAGERWDGVPARRTGRTPDVPAVAPGLGAWTHAAAIGGARAMARAVSWGPAWLFAIGAVVVADVRSVAGLGAWMGTPPFWGVAAIGSPTALMAALALGAAICRRLPRETAGVVAARSWTSVRVELKARLLDGASLWLSGSLFWPHWLRAAGMRLGAQAEVSSIVDTVPDLVTVGKDAFFADGIYLAAPRVDRGTLTIAPVHVGARAFLGNHAVLGPGTLLPDDALLGVCTVATPAMADAPGAAWFGHPPLPLARRPSTADRRTTHQPSALRRLNRWTWETARAALPLGLLAVGAWWIGALAATTATGVALVLRVSAVTAAAAASLALACLALKWLLLGKVRPGEHGLWSCWCSRWDFMYVAWSLYVPWFVDPLEGTVWLPWYLRAMGMRVGRRVLLGHGFAEVVDPDMIAIGDGATVQALFQAHTFEDRVLKMGPVSIAAGATVGAGVVPLYATSVGEGAHVAAHSVILKGESLSPHTAYAGSPVAPC